MEQAYGLIVSQYVEQVDGSNLVEGAIQGMLSRAERSLFRIYVTRRPLSNSMKPWTPLLKGSGLRIGMERW